MGLRLMCAVGAVVGALLLLLTAAIVRLLILLIQLLTLRYTLSACVVALALWFLHSRRQRYAKGFYSCSHVPLAEETEPEQEQQDKPDTPLAAVAPVTDAVVKKAPAPPPSETESEDDSESSAASKPDTAGHSKSMADVRARSNTSDGDLQRRLATRPRSSSSTSDRPRASTSRGYRPEERKRRVPRRRADTGTTKDQHTDRARRATFTSKQDAYMAASRSSSEMLEDALRSDGYWIGDFSVQRRLVSRRGHGNSPKAG